MRGACRRTRVLERVLEQVAQCERDAVCIDAQRNRRNLHAKRHVSSLDLIRIVSDDGIDERRQAHDVLVQPAAIDVRIGKQVVDQRRHLERAVADAREIVARGVRKLRIELRLEQMRESVDCAQRRLQVMRDGIRETFQLVVRRLELYGALRHALFERRVELTVARFAQSQLRIRRLQLLIRGDELGRQLLGLLLNPRLSRPQHDCKQDEQGGGPGDDARRQRGRTAYCDDHHDDDEERGHDCFKPSLA